MPNERQLLQNAPGILSAILSPTPLGIGALAANVGASFLAERDQDKARKKAQAQQDQNVAMANLINSFGGRATPSPVQQKQGIGAPARLLSAIGQALPVIAGLQDQSQQRTRQARMDDLMEQNVQSQMQSRDLAGKQRQEALQSSLFQSLGRSGVTPESRVPVTEESLFTDAAPKTTFRPISDTAPPLNVISSLAEGNREFVTAQENRAAELQQTLLNNRIALEKLNQADRRILADEARLDMELQTFKDNLNAVKSAPSLSLKDQAGIESGLRKEFTALTKNHRTIGEAFEKILVGAEKPTGATDLSLIFNFMKMLDPGSVVRESEFQNAEQTGSFSDSMQNTINRFWDGERLTTTRADFLEQAINIYKSQLPAYQELSKNFSGIADRNNVNAANVVLSMGVNIPKAEEVLAKVKALSAQPPDTQPSGALGTLDSILQSIGVSK